jgi:hypothetical protein
MPTTFKHKCTECLPHLLDRCRVSIIVRSGGGKSLFLKACVRGGGRFVRGVQRHHNALNAVYSPVLFKTRPTRRLDISPRRAPPDRPYIHASSGGRSRWPSTRPSCGCSHRIALRQHPHGFTWPRETSYLSYIYNDVANAGPGRPAGSAAGASFSVGEFLRGISGSALWAKAASRRCYLEK